MAHGGPASLLLPKIPDRPIDLAARSFDAMEVLARLYELVDQPRAHETIRFGTEMGVRSFNIDTIRSDAIPDAVGVLRVREIDALRLG
jgi:hypothetical protein